MNGRNNESHISNHGEAAVETTIIGHGVPVSGQDSFPGEESLRHTFPGQQHYSPYVGRNFPSRVVWGDTHLHAGMSMDAGAFGARLGPEDDYRFARGDGVSPSTGLRVKLSRPPDFLLVGDHSNNMGLSQKLFFGVPAMLQNPRGRSGMTWLRPGDRRG